MEWITVEDLENISIGATLLGTGGGGDPFVGRLMAAGASKIWSSEGFTGRRLG